MSAPTDRRYFFIIGAMKAGTTSLYKYLAGHPELYASPRKEPRIFRDGGDSARIHAEFMRLFEGSSGQRWCFEASTAYTKYPQFPGIPGRIRTIVPDARFVYLVRNPVERAWSQYVHNVAHGRERRPFAEAMQARPHYLNISRYHLQLEQYFDVFSRDRVLVQVFEEMVADPVATVRAVCEFLEVDASYRPPSSDVAYNASADKRAAAPALRVVRTLGVEDIVPGRMRQWLKERGTPLPSKRSEFTPELRRLAVEALRPDTEAFFTLFGRRIASWSDFA